MRMRILQIGKFYPPHMGGIETHLQTLCVALRRHCDVKVVVANDGHRARRTMVDGVPVARIGKLFEVSAAPVCPGMLPEIRRSEADIVHLHTPNPTGALAYLASRHRGWLVVTWHSDILRQRNLKRILAPLDALILGRASAVVVTSDAYKKSSPVLRSYQSKCRVIPYGIALDRFNAINEQAVAEIRRRYGSRIVLAVGRMVYYKGFENLIRAMAHVSANLVLIGDGPLRAALEKQAVNLAVASRIAFVGELQNEATLPYYRAADVFVLPSIARTEAFGIVQIEAMAAGTPVINTLLDSGVPTVSVDRLTGLTVAPGDSESLGQAINGLLDNPGHRALYGQNGRHRAQAHFSADAMCRSMLELYRDVIDGRRELRSNAGANSPA
jgi:rhamnosyl/mannosyltransferase